LFKESEGILDKIKQNEFEIIVNKFSGIETYRGDIWYRCRELLERGYSYEAYSLLLATWNFARFRYFLKDIIPEVIESLIKKTEDIYDKLEDINFENFDFNNPNIIRYIKEIYNLYRPVKGIEQTGASKLMALRRPDLFVMWDTEIRKFYSLNNEGSAEDYIQFLKEIKQRFNHLKWESQEKPLAKAIDEFNYHIVHMRNK